MRAYNLAQLIFASEMAFPETMMRAMQEHCPGDEFWKHEYYRWSRQYNRDLFAYIFSYSRADLQVAFANGVTLGEFLERVLNTLIGDYQG